MNVKPIAHSYWRCIKRGTRTYESVGAALKDDVKYLAKTDVQNSVITEEEYLQYIGEAYTAE